MESVARAAAPEAPVMDREFISRNQIVERYLAGRLPPKGALDFERFCAARPELLDELGLADRVHAGLRLLEAGGKPEPWREPPQKLWRRPAMLASSAGLCLVLMIGLVVTGSRAAKQSQELVRLRQQVREQPIRAASSVHTVRVIPSRNGIPDTPALAVGGIPVQFTDLKIDQSHSPYRIFRVTVDRVGEGRLLVLQNLAKDSNGDLRIGLNDSALGSGDYRFTIEGLNWRGEPAPDAWVTLAIRH